MNENIFIITLMMRFFFTTESEVQQALKQQKKMFYKSMHMFLMQNIPELRLPKAPVSWLKLRILQQQYFLLNYYEPSQNAR